MLNWTVKEMCRKLAGTDMHSSITAGADLLSEGCSWRLVTTARGVAACRESLSPLLQEDGKDAARCQTLWAADAQVEVKA